MNKKILQFNTYSAALNAAAQLINARNVDLSVRHTVITPEKYTLLCEKSLFKNNNGAFDAEVFSLGRLYYKSGGGFCLPKEGAVMLLREILSGAELKCFNRSKKYKGFCERLYKTIADLILCGVSPDGLSADNLTPALRLKLEDVKDVYKEFLMRTAGMRVDRHGKLEAIRDALNAQPELFCNAHVYLVNFDYITKLEQEIFDTIAVRCLSFTQFYVRGELPPPVPAEIYCAPDAPKAVKAAARRILDAAKSGVKFSDICVVCAPKTLLPAQRIFAEYGIPLYCAQSDRLADSPAARYLLSLLRLKSPTRKDYVALSKNQCTDIGADESAVFENYCSRFLIDYAAFNSPFDRIDPEDPDERQRASAEKTRRRLHLLVSVFWNEIESVKSVKDFCAVIDKTIAPHSTDTQTAAKVSEILSLMEKTLNYQPSTFTSILTEGIESAQLGSLPPAAECVIAADASAFRGASPKYTFILDFNEGIIPACAEASGVLNRTDAAALTAAGVESGLSPDEANEIHRREVLQLMAASEKLFICYLKTDDLRPSPLLYSLNNLQNIYDSFDAEESRLQEENTEFMSFYAACPSAGLEYLLLSAQEPTALTSALYELLFETADKFLFDTRVSHPPVEAEVFNQKTISVSRLQAYFSCPYKHFVRHGLRAKEKPDGEVSKREAGAVIHKMAEKFVLSGLDENALDTILDETPFGYKYDLPQNAEYKAKLKKEIKKLCLIFAANIKSGAFKPLGAEIKVQDLTVPADIGGLKLTGSIDYTDACGDYARIIDYKSGGEDFEEKTLHYGIKLQLPLYMHALMQNGYRPAAMHFFKFKDRWQDGAFRFTGVYNSDPYVVGNTDFAIKDGGESTVTTAALTVGDDGVRVTGSGSKTEEQLVAYCDYAVKVARLAIRQIKDGNVTPSPYYQDAKHNACVYCTFKPACGGAAICRRV